MSNQIELTAEDLDKIVIDGAQGITAKSATDEQFHRWADDLVAFEIGDVSWPIQDRLNFCNFARGDFKEGE